MVEGEGVKKKRGRPKKPKLAKPAKLLKDLGKRLTSKQKMEEKKALLELAKSAKEKKTKEAKKKAEIPFLQPPPSTIVADLQRPKATPVPRMTVAHPVPEVAESKEAKEEPKKRESKKGGKKGPSPLIEGPGELKEGRVKADKTRRIPTHTSEGTPVGKPLKSGIEQLSGSKQEKRLMEMERRAEEDARKEESGKAFLTEVAESKKLTPKGKRQSKKTEAELAKSAEKVKGRKEEEALVKAEREARREEGENQMMQKEDKAQAEAEDAIRQMEQALKKKPESKPKPPTTPPPPARIQIVTSPEEKYKRPPYYKGPHTPQYRQWLLDHLGHPETLKWFKSESGKEYLREHPEIVLPAPNPKGRPKAEKKPFVPVMETIPEPPSRLVPREGRPPLVRSGSQETQESTQSSQEPRSRSSTPSLGLSSEASTPQSSQESLTLSDIREDLEDLTLDELAQLAGITRDIPRTEGSGVGRGKRFSHKQLTDIILHKNKVIEDLEKNAYGDSDSDEEGMKGSGIISHTNIMPMRQPQRHPALESSTMTMNPGAYNNIKPLMGHLMGGGVPSEVYRVKHHGMTSSHYGEHALMPQMMAMGHYQKHPAMKGGAILPSMSDLIHHGVQQIAKRFGVHPEQAEELLHTALHQGHSAVPAELHPLAEYGLSRGLKSLKHTMGGSIGQGFFDDLGSKIGHAFTNVGNKVKDTAVSVGDKIKDTAVKAGDDAKAKAPGALRELNRGYNSPYTQGALMGVSTALNSAGMPYLGVPLSMGNMALSNAIDAGANNRDAGQQLKERYVNLPNRYLRKVGMRIPGTGGSIFDRKFSINDVKDTGRELFGGSILDEKFSINDVGRTAKELFGGEVGDGLYAQGGKGLYASGGGVKRPAKGSQEAKDHMARLRAMKGKGVKKAKKMKGEGVAPPSRSPVTDPELAGSGLFA